MITQVDNYGTQQPIALMKLLLDRGGIYDRGKDLNYKILKDLGFVAAMGKAGGGRNEVDPRFVSLFSVFSIPFPALESLHLIYASIIKGHTKVRIASLHIMIHIIIQSSSYLLDLIHVLKYYSLLRTSYRTLVIKSLSAHWNSTTISSKICHLLRPSFTTSST